MSLARECLNNKLSKAMHIFHVTSDYSTSNRSRFARVTVQRIPTFL